MVPFLLQVFLISLSGVMAPGPISAVVVGKGSQSPRSGAWVAIGHGAFEIPLMAATFFGLGALLQRPGVETAIALIGGLFLLYMGVGMLRTLRSAQLQAARDDRSPVLVGWLLTAGNPYFLLWWATVGAALIARAASMGVQGLLSLALVHWSCDLAWLSLLSVISFKGATSWGTASRRRCSVYRACSCSSSGRASSLPASVVSSSSHYTPVAIRLHPAAARP